VWTTARPKKAIISPRPVRIAFLVPHTPNHELLDVLFAQSMSRWGGRRTPIIPTDGVNLHIDYWNLLNIWDADIIYSYVILSEKLHQRLAHQLSPSNILIHRNDHDHLRPDFATNAKPLEATSLLPILARRRAFRTQTLPYVLDKERQANIPSDLVDSFGFTSNSLNDFSLLPHARRLCLRLTADTQSLEADEEVVYIDGLEALEMRIANDRGLLCLAQLSDVFAPYLNM